MDGLALPDRRTADESWVRVGPPAPAEFILSGRIPTIDLPPPPAAPLLLSRSNASCSATDAVTSACTGSAPTESFESRASLDRRRRGLLALVVAVSLKDVRSFLLTLSADIGVWLIFARLFGGGTSPPAARNLSL